VGTPQRDTAGSSRLPPLLTYTALRVVLMIVVGAFCYLVGLRSWALVVIALLASLPMSYLLLRRQREALSASVDARLAVRRELRAQLRGDDDAPP
jgi:predicted permease